ALEQQVEQTQQKIHQSRLTREQSQPQIKQLQQKLQAIQGKKVSLEALQQAALGKKSEHVSDWLEKHQLANYPRLAENIQVDSGWEIAVETVLGENLQAVLVDEKADPLALFEDFSKGAITLMQTGNKAAQETSHEQLTPLVSKIQTREDLNLGLDHVFISEDLSHALKLRLLLKSHQSIITQDGIWIGSSWLKVNKEVDASAGILKREKELAEAIENIDRLEMQLEEMEEAQIALDRQLKVLENDWESHSKNLMQLNALHSDKKRSLESKKIKQQHLQDRLGQLEAELQEIQLHNKDSLEIVAESRMQLEELVDRMANDNEQREKLMMSREERRVNMNHVREQAREDKDLVHKLALRTESIRAELNSTKNSQERAKSQVIELKERLHDLAEKLEDNETPIEEMKLELEESLTRHLEVESSLKNAREVLDLCDQELRVLEKQRHSFEQNHEAVRRKLESQKIQHQTFVVQRDTQLNILHEAKYDLQTLLDNLDGNANEASWTEQLNTLANQIERLGAINLAAIEEYGAQSERKTYLDTQNEDLVKALETLESAIRKIDRETRTKFKETFDRINKGLQELFPKVFGGGHAYLELTGEDLLDTGVTIMARPPGKRNSTIHLLSGGEKAMTAIALVFAIFRLNPAPFCMLDEVDAPLDDANVGRFCKLVKEMSETVQFIYISHNKQAMEMAGALVGVTMQEAGVSRMVSVDISEAVAMVAS
ncbi:MAG: chromosome segregation protein SMC, partial [Gammaproteobacteria bacterium CG22_combo_CG10-13_8_21_14_all_40_8]